MTGNPEFGQAPVTPGEKHQIDPDPIQPGDVEIQIPADPMKIDTGEEDNEHFGDGKEDLGNAIEQPHTTTTPTAEYDGIRDGDRDAPDEILYDEEEDYNRERQ